MKTPCLCESTEGDNPQCRLHPQPQYDERGCEIFDVPGCMHVEREKITVRPQQPPATDAAKDWAVEVAGALLSIEEPDDEWIQEAAKHLRRTCEPLGQPTATDDKVTKCYDGCGSTDIREKAKYFVCGSCGMIYDKSKHPKPATDNKQWTLKDIFSIWEDCYGVKGFADFPKFNHELLKRVNAALKAEREKHEKELHQLAIYLEGNCYADPDFMADSRALKAAVDLRQQLLSAQAAIAEALNIPGRNDFGDRDTMIRIRGCLEPVEISALDKYVAEVKAKIWREAPDQPDVQEAVIAKLDLVHRHAIEKAVAEKTKPLVEQLQRAREYCRKPWQVNEIDDALAKVKE